MEASPVGIRERVIEPPKRWPMPDLRGLWDSREMVYMFAKRDLVVRYKQSVVGIFWSILQPLALAGVFTLFLGVLANVEAPKGIPQPLYMTSGIIMWLFFANALGKCSSSTMESADLISKVDFPRLVVPVSAALPTIVDFAIGMVVVIPITLAYGVVPGVQVVLLPLIGLLALATALGFGLWFSALNVKYRDFSILVPTLILVGLFITPIVYPFDAVPAHLQAFYAINPMVGVMEVYRWALLDFAWPGWLLAIPLVTATTTIVTGAIYFQRAQQRFVDIL